MTLWSDVLRAPSRRPAWGSSSRIVGLAGNAEEMPLLRALSRVVDLFWARTEIPGHSLYARLDRSHPTARTLTRCYYSGLLLIAFWPMSLCNYYRGLRDIQPLWPVAWAASVPDRAATVVLLLFASGSLLAAVFP